MITNAQRGQTRKPASSTGVTDDGGECQATTLRAGPAESSPALTARALMPAREKPSPQAVKLAGPLSDRDFERVITKVVAGVRNHRYRHSLAVPVRSEEHTSELQSLMRNSYAVVCLKKKNKKT